MSKGVRNVRRSIKQRRKNRHYSNRINNKRTELPLRPIDDHDRHGELPPYVPEQLIRTNKKYKVFSFKSYIKLFVSAVLILVAFVLLKTNFVVNHELTDWFEKQMTKDFPFARMNEWYQETFGHPLAINPIPQSEQEYTDTHVLPVSGAVSETFQINGRGIMIAPQKDAQVTAWNDGIVIFSGNDRKTGKTVVVQHADQSQTTYGYLSDINVHLYQHVTNGQHIGNFTPSVHRDSVYFSLEKENEYIDPIQVIQVDDR